MQRQKVSPVIPADAKSSHNGFLTTPKRNLWKTHSFSSRPSNTLFKNFRKSVSLFSLFHFFVNVSGSIGFGFPLLPITHN